MIKKESDVSNTVEFIQALISLAIIPMFLISGRYPPGRVVNGSTFQDAQSLGLLFLVRLKQRNR